MKDSSYIKILLILIPIMICLVLLLTVIIGYQKNEHERQKGEANFRMSNCVYNWEIDQDAGCYCAQLAVKEEIRVGLENSTIERDQSWIDRNC